MLRYKSIIKGDFPMSAPIRIHPMNPKLFEFRGKPFVLVTATEHYGAVMNRPFQFEKYLHNAADQGHTLSRLFVLFRELQNQCNPYSTCKPESPDYIAPFLRVGPEDSQDGQPKFDLDQWNPELFSRLHRFLDLASDLGIVVEVVLMSNSYAPEVWRLNPLNSGNNINGLPEIPFSDYNTLRHPDNLSYQLRHVRKIVQETNRYDNIFFEICNEPGGWIPNEQGLPTTDEVNQWQEEVAKTIREVEAKLPNQHLIAGHLAFTYSPWEHPATESFSGPLLDIVNIHPLPNITYSGNSYDMGVFMSKQLCLKPFRNFCLDTWKERKPLNMDEDNIASQYKDVEGWTIHRKRAWTALLSGAHYDYIDFSIINYCETGTEGSRKHIRAWIGYLANFMHSMDLSSAEPIRGVVHNLPDFICESVYGVVNKDISLYLADSRERGTPGCGEKLQLTIQIDAPIGIYQMASFSPVTGLYSPWLQISSDGQIALISPVFTHDLVIRLKRIE
jgi:hypothetical protein